MASLLDLIRPTPESIQQQIMQSRMNQDVAQPVQLTQDGVDTDYLTQLQNSPDYSPSPRPRASLPIPAAPSYAPTNGSEMEAESRDSIDSLMAKLASQRDQSREQDRNQQWMSFFSKLASSKANTLLGGLGEGAQALTDTTAKQAANNQMLDQSALQEQIKYQEWKREQARQEAAQRATQAYQQGQLGLDRAKLEQGKFQMSPYGQVLNTRTGEIIDNGFTGAGASAVDDKGNPLTGDAYLKTLDPRVATLAKQYANGDVAWPSGFALKNPMVLQATIAAQQYDPSANGNRFSAVKAFNTGKQGDLVRSLDVSTQHLDVLDTLGKALKTGDTKLLNTAKNAWKEQFGEEAPTDFNTAKTIVANEVVKSIVGGQNAEADRAKAQAAFDAAKSPEQLSGALKTVKSLMKGQINGVKQQYENSTGRKDFYTRLTPPTRQLFETMPDNQMAEPSGGEAPKAIHFNDLPE